MTFIFTQTELEVFTLSSLILVFTGDVASQTVVMITYYGSNPVVEGDPTVFTGTFNASGNARIGQSFAVKPVGSSTFSTICFLDLFFCNGYVDITCYCESQVGDIHYIVIKDTARLERSLASIRPEQIGKSNGPEITYPEIIPQTKTTKKATSTTTTTTTTVPTTRRQKRTATTDMKDNSSSKPEFNENGPSRTETKLRNIWRFLRIILPPLPVILILVIFITATTMHLRNRQQRQSDEPREAEQQAEETHDLKNEERDADETRTSISIETGTSI